MTKTPEHDKLHTISDKSQTCGEFLDWLTGPQRIVLAEYHTHDDKCYEDDVFSPPRHSKRRQTCGMSEQVLYPIAIKTTKLLAQFFGIDETRLENEKRMILEELRTSASEVR